MDNGNVGVFSVLGKEGVSLKDGEYLGKIQLVTVNREEKKVTGVYIKQKGILSGRLFIPFSGVEYFGQHTVTIKENYGQENHPGDIEEKDILEMPVITVTGTLLGKVESFTFERSTGRITQYILSGGILEDALRGKGLLKGDEVARIGKDVIITVAGVDENNLAEVEGEVEFEDWNTAEEDLATAQGEEPGDEEVQDQEIQDNLAENFAAARNSAEKSWQQVVQQSKKLTEEWANVLKDQADKLSGEAKELLTVSNKKLEKLNQVKDKWQSKLNIIQNKKEDELSVQLLEEIKNKTVSKTLYDADNQPIILPGEVITQQVLQKAIEKGKLHELFLLTAAKDVEDQLEKVEKEQ